MKIKCPGCATLLQIPDSAAGKVVKCKCGKQLRAPAKQPVAAGAKAAGNAGSGKAAAAVRRPQSASASPAAARPAARSAQVGGIPAATAAVQPAAANDLFAELTDADLSGVKGVKIPGTEQRLAPSANEQKALQAAASDYQRDKRQEQAAYMEGAKKEIVSSIGIYLLLGAVQVGFGIFFLTQLEKEVEFLSVSQEGNLDVQAVTSALRAGYTIKVCLGIMFFIASATFMILPMTSAIGAIITFVLGEIVSLILNPFLIINIRAWIVRAAMFGALIQAINNASYFRFVKAGGREKDASGKPAVRPEANKMNTRSLLAGVGAAVGVLATFGLGGFYVVNAANQPVGQVADTGFKGEIPDGFQHYAAHGVSVFLPKGYTIEPEASEMEYRAIMTSLGTVFMMGAVDVGEELSGEALKAKMERITGGVFLRHQTSDRKGYRCEQGTLTKATRFAPKENMRAPMMNVEVFQDDGRLIVLGVAQEQSSSENIIVGQSAEPELEAVFWDSLNIGPKPAGGGFFF